MELQAEFTIGSIVDAMLPRFSDPKLGVLISIKIDASDYGYGTDGNTLERKPLHAFQIVHFIFTRHSNYTQVYSWIPPKEAKGLDLRPEYNNSVVWRFEMDHDDCWRDAINSVLQDEHYAIMMKFNGRKISGEKMLPYRDVSQFNVIESQPRYVRILVNEKVNKAAERYTNEGRATLIKYQDVAMYDLIQLKSPYPEIMAHSGLLFKDEKRHIEYLQSCLTIQKQHDESKKNPLDQHERFVFP